MSNDFGLEITERKFELIPAGNYDFIIHGIVNVGVRKPYTELTPEGKKALPKNQIKVIFEFPSSIRDDGETNVSSLNLAVSLHGKSSMFKLFNACFGQAIIDGYDKQGNPTMKSEYLTASHIEKLLGSVGTLTIIHKATDNRTYARIKPDSLVALHPLVPKPIATRETFLFNPLQPDLEVFKNKLTYWTQKEIMEAMNVEAFPTELHKAWLEIQEERNNKEEKADPVVGNADTSSIE